MLSRVRVVIKQNLDLKLVEDQKNPLHKRELEMLGRGALNLLILEVGQLPWALKIGIILFL